MCKIKRIILPAVSVLVTVTVIVSNVIASRTKVEPSYGIADTSKYEVRTNRHTQYVDTEEAVCLLTTAGFEKKMDNGILSVWYSEELESIRVVDLRTGYVWGCMDDKEAYGLNKKWAARATSICDISYYNMEGKAESAALSEKEFSALYQWGETSFDCEVSAKKLGISFLFTASLEDDRLVFEMKDEDIRETKKNLLASVSFMPFFGAVYKAEVPGYILVPDGSGALIRFQAAKDYQSGYSRKIYGNDLAIDRDITLSNLNATRTDDYATEENQLSLPLWGMVHGENQNGFLATVDSGELYATIQAVPAGAMNKTVKISRAYATFVYRTEYNKRVSNSKTVTMPQEELNRVDAKLTYTFLAGEDANYSGMARTTRSQLLERGLLPEGNQTDRGEDTSLLLHVVGSEVKKGFLSNRLARLTTVDEAEDILERLGDEGISNVSVLLSGWNKGGYHGGSYGTTAFEKNVGSRKEIEKLQEIVRKNGGEFALVVNAVTANKDQIRINQDAALNATLDTVLKEIPNKSLMYQTTYYMRHTRVKDALEKAFRKLDGFDLLLEGIGTYLYSDYTIRDENSRDEVQAELLDTVARAEQKLLLDGQNLYMLNYASGLVNVPVSNSQYVYETDSVPFLQMVIRGSVDYYAPYSNQGFYSEASILKMIEYGAYSSFMVMGADNFSLNDTPLENYFSLNFNDWEEKIYEVYGKVNEALSPVLGAEMVSHKAEAEGVYCTVYNNGCKVWVNYNEESYTSTSGITVPACGYAVEE